ncbi:hypothetical protein B0A50_04892 [Salinomyces thailandicus]|uniref:DUF1640-domain-containing protein n=1 Tax=Salinomyces thailandicus TaxID=706561 RepID=A0A4U0TYZ3_9PEZI|nr:hypothetical protein B0A50_04892 [Salinomyces thailandica]
MSVPLAASTARAAHRLPWTASAIRPSLISTQHQHQPTPQHSRHDRRTAATTAFAQAQWASRRTRQTPQTLQSPTHRRPFSTTPPLAKDHHFDTLKFVQRLRAEGFSETQAEAMMRVLSDVIEESIQNLTRTMVLREDQEKATYTQKVDFAKLRSELLSADSTESSLTRGTHERLTNDLAKLNSRLRDEVQRTQASVRLDLNLEKGRIREEANSQDLKIKETETRIEQECAALRERLEAVKFSTLQWLMGVCTGTAAIILGVWRLLM